MRWFFSFIVFLWLLSLAAQNRVAADEDAQRRLFEQAAKVLSTRCLQCHNPEDHRGDFSLHTRAALIDSGNVDVDEPLASQLLDSVVGDNGEKPSMPKESKPLTAVEVTALRAWLKAGMPWPEGEELEPPTVRDFDHWSLQPLHSTTPPVFDDDEARNWIRTPTDAFILRKLRSQGLAPSTEADRRTLIRRVTYDLVGLPPTPEEVREFENDSRPDAYRRLVDRLLASPRYGERWGRHWLDVAKYADTCGYDKDKLRNNAWPYRDYVIRSFNQDKPFGRFAEEQIAGDVLYPNTADGILGMGFIAAGPWDFIGHVEVPESKIDGRVARHLDRDEMVSNTMNTFCSVTIQCARCHNHKFDPFTQEHYYSLQAVFAAMDRAERPYSEDEESQTKRAKLAKQVDEARARLKELEAEIVAEGGERLVNLRKKHEALRAASEPINKKPEYGYHSAIAPKQNVEKWVEVDLSQPQAIEKIVLHPCHDEFNKIGAGFGFPVRYRVETRNEPSEPFRVAGDFTKLDQPNPGISAVELQHTATARFVRITATKLVRRANDFILAMSEIEVLDEEGKNLAIGAKVNALDSIEAPTRWGKRNLTDNIWPAAKDPGAGREAQEVALQLMTMERKLDTPQRQTRREQWTAAVQAAEKALRELPTAKMVYAGAAHFKPQGNFHPTGGTPREIHVLHRGEILKPKHKVGSGRIPLKAEDVWRFELPEDHVEGDRRAMLARWISDPHNPLTWRSITNRIWQYHFGRGLAARPNDFGRMGAEPTHPELLDYLANRLLEGDQSIKRLHRELVLSATYRQSSTHNGKYAEIDAANRFLWRMNRRRLEAEAIRDSVLAVSQRLDTRMGGPGYYLFVLEKTAHSPHYEYHKFDPNDAASHRRSVYRFVVRSQPDPFMTTLDCADSSQSTPRRNETLTSLQALSMLNNRFTLVMSEHFAESLETQHQQLDQQIDEAMRRVTGRAPTKAEHQAFSAYAKQHGLSNLCRVLLNLSELVYLD